KGRRHPNVPTGFNDHGRSEPPGQPVKRRTVNRSHCPLASASVTSSDHLSHEVASPDLTGETRHRVPHGIETGLQNLIWLIDSLLPWPVKCAHCDMKAKTFAHLSTDANKFVMRKFLSARTFADGGSA